MGSCFLPRTGSKTGPGFRFKDSVLGLLSEERSEITYLGREVAAVPVTHYDSSRWRYNSQICHVRTGLAAANNQDSLVNSKLLSLLEHRRMKDLRYLVDSTNVRYIRLYM